MDLSPRHECAAAYEITDAAAAQTVKFGNSRPTKLRMLWENTVHDNLHYGNLITYLRRPKASKAYWIAIVAPDGVDTPLTVIVIGNASPVTPVGS
jgi:hypothetical protein